MEFNFREIGLMITDYFTSPKINQVAYKSGFVQRSNAKLNGLLFLQAFVFASLEHVNLTLSKVAQSCADVGLAISEQGSDARINQRSVAFMREMFAEAMQKMVNKQPLLVSLLAQFSAVNLIDSSGIPLPVSMAELYPASRNTQAANLKLRVVFDFLYGRFQQVLLVPGRQADQGFTASHQIAVNMEGFGGGKKASADLCDQDIVCNMNLLPGEPGKAAMNPKGVRLGVQEMTRFGMGPDEMDHVGELMHAALASDRDVRPQVAALRERFPDVRYGFAAGDLL